MAISFMPQTTFSLTVRAIVQETKDTYSLVFERSSYLLDHQAGQFITLIVTIGQEVMHRSYSLASYPETDAYPFITIKRVPGGRVSNYLYNRVRVGDSLQALPSAGRFVLPKVFSKGYKAVFIAGGSGIVPIFSLIKALLYGVSYAEAMLVYANRDEENIIYADGLRELGVRYGARIRVVHVLSSPSGQWQGEAGRLTSERLGEFLQGGWIGEGVDYFLCGPEGLMGLAEDTLGRLGVVEEHVHRESFIVKKEGKLGVAVAQVTMHYEGEVYVCEVDSGTSLLDAALGEGVDIPFSCGSGICNTCRARCVRGRVRMLEDEGLTKEELDEGYVLTCVGYAATEDVVLEVD